MLRNILLKTLRDYRTPILVWGLGLAALMATFGQSYASLFSGANRGKLLEDFKKTSDSFAILSGKATDVSTLGGFVTTRVMGFMPVLISIMALIAGSALIRGEEEKGSLDLLLSTPHSRASVFLQKWAGLGIVLFLISGLAWSGLIAGAAGSTESLDYGAAGVAFLNVFLVTLLFGTLALLFGQLFSSRKTAAGWAGGFLAGTYLINNLAEIIPDLAWMRFISPFYYYRLSKPMAPGADTNLAALAFLAIISLILAGLALVMYLQRDHNNTFQLGWKKNLAAPEKTPAVGRPTSPRFVNPFLFSLNDALPGVIIWGIGITAYIFLIMSSLNGIKDSLQDFLNTDIYRRLGFKSLVTNENLTGIMVFSFVVLLVAAYAVITVNGWTGDENEGRLELLLSTPLPRVALQLNRFLVALVSSTLLLGFIAVAFVFCTWAFQVPTDGGKTAATFLGLWTVCLVVESLGFFIAAIGPGRAVAILSGIVIVSYLVEVFAILLSLPGWVLNLSVFHQFGNPMLDGVNWFTQLLMVGAGIAFLALASARFYQRDLVK